ncbi:MAG: hypothetical protein ACMG6S_13760 [Byssovorax sp.]
MGQLDQFAKQIFAEETELATGGAARFQEPVELNLTEVRLDGMLLVRDGSRMLHLGAPWSEAGGLDEIVLEVKMQGDHVSMLAVQRALLRRQARQVQRAEDVKTPWDGEQALWFLAPHVPKILKRKRLLERVARGCYQVGPASFPFLWITANELPLSDELIPFLIARSGRPLDEFCRWVVTRKPLAWVMRMVEFLPMSEPVYKEMTGWLSAASYDPRLRERKANWERILQEAEQRALEELVKEGRNEGRLAEAREGLRRVLALRKLAPTGDDEARIEACADLATLHRWHDQAIEALTAAEALR